MRKKKTISQNHNKTKFILKGNSQGHYKCETQIQFKLTKKSPLYKTVSDTPLFPIFNHDRKHYTPTFVLPKLQTLKQEEYIKLHSQKVQESMREVQQEQIMVPKPRSKNKYCGVCRSYYEQYLEHTKSTQHFNCLKNSMFHQHIGQLCRQFQFKFMEVDTSNMEKTDSTQTKDNEDENSTESILEHKKQDKPDQNLQIQVYQENIQIHVGQ